jgi:hypothetical protein
MAQLRIQRRADKSWWVTGGSCNLGPYVTRAAARAVAKELIIKDMGRRNFIKGELWRPVVGFEQVYSVSNLGRLRRDVGYKGGYAGQLLSPGVSGEYLTVKLCNGSQTRLTKVHILVLETFIGPRPQGYEGCHRNGNPLDCRLDNLRWGTVSSNQMDRVNHGTSNRGERHGMARLSNEDIKRIHNKIERGISLSVIAKTFGITVRHVRRIKSGERRQYG